jgi:(p)ppGpp synthase/HD superfamily hydrolase
MEDINNWQAKFESCQYADRLINKLLLLNKATNSAVDIQEVKKAIYYAKKYHGNQKRKSGEPYYSHPIEVAYMVADYIFKTDAVVVSILHDTIEDTELTFDMIKEIFDEAVACQVMDLTRIKENGKISSAEMISTLFKQKKYEVLLIKQLDRLHNMQTVGIKSPEKAKKIIEETLLRFISLSIYLGVPKIEQELSELCIKNIKLLNRKQELLQDNFLIPSLILQSKIFQIHNLLP